MDATIARMFMRRFCSMFMNLAIHVIMLYAVGLDDVSKPVDNIHCRPTGICENVGKKEVRLRAFDLSQDRV